MIIEFASLAGQPVLRERASAAARFACFPDALLGQENIGGLQIAMADALLVRSVEHIANLCGVLQWLIDRERSFENRALDALHDQVIRPHIVGLANVASRSEPEVWFCEIIPNKTRVSEMEHRELADCSLNAF
jgi:hypothetical protein